MYFGLSKKLIEKVAYTAHDPMSRKRADWWEDHQEEDKRRIAAEKKRK